MEKLLYENEDYDSLVYNDETKDLVWIKDDTVTYIEKTDDLMERVKAINYFSKFLPLDALRMIVMKLKGEI